MRENVKAAKRQNKLLGVALGKANDHKIDLEHLSDQIAIQRNVAYKNSVQMPDLIYSPFLPLEQQIEQQRQRALAIGEANELPSTDFIFSPHAQNQHEIEQRQAEQQLNLDITPVTNIEFQDPNTHTGEM